MPAVTVQDLDLEHAEWLPARETLLIGAGLPRFYNPSGPNVPLSGSLPRRLA